MRLGVGVHNNEALLSDVTGGGVALPVGLAKWRAAAAAVKAGTANARGLHLGDSTTIGTIGNGTHYRPNVTKHLADDFVAAGIPANDAAFSGMSDFSSAKRLFKDLRITGDWAMQASNTLGGFMAKATSAGETLTFTPEVTCDTFRIFWWGIGSSTMDITATGGATTNVVMSSGGTQFGTTALRYVDVSAASLTGGNAVTLEMISGTTVYCTGIEAWDSTTKQVIVSNAGWFGSKTSDWIGSSSNRGPLDILTNMPSDYYSYVIINAGINDKNNSTDIATVFKPNVQTLIDAVGSKADVVLESCNPISAGGTQAYSDALGELATLNNLQFINVHDDAGWTDYTTANANGYMGDTLHPNSLGFGAKADIIKVPFLIGV